MGRQLHKKFSDIQIKELIQRYLEGKVKRNHIQQVLGIGKTRFFALVKKYREEPCFSIEYTRKNATNKISLEVQENIVTELAKEKELIIDPNIPLRFYNYSYIKDRLFDIYGQKVSLPTIISHAKSGGFYIKKKIKEPHCREVITNYAGELVQHDSSHHKWSPYAKDKWYLITSIDDYSRYMLYANLVEKESSWVHIQALESVVLRYGLPCSYYVDSHSVFRFVQGRDSFYRKHLNLTDDINPQWKQVLNDLGVEITYALSPQAKGKIERPYGWLQDRIVRTCAREGIDNIKDAQKVLRHEINAYNNKRIHSTTGEVPYFRFQRAIKEKVSLFRQFVLIPPFKSTKDIFAYRLTRIVDAYRKISINNLEIKLSASPREHIDIRIYPLNSQVSEVRFWVKDKLIDIQKLKNNDLKMVHF
jgi:hypothetical protein